MKRVLITPLDWGFGHATRCIPIINELLKRKCEVLIAGSGDSLKLLTAEFPSLEYFSIHGYNPVYPRSGSMVWKMALQLPKFFKTIHAEHATIERLVRKKHIDLVISDNRYGCWSSLVPCIFITHQSNILMPQRFGWLQGMVRYLNASYMQKFTRCWVPDFPEPHNIAGDMISFGKSPTEIKIDFIGTLSRFTPSAPKEKKYDITAIFSGPEPQRSVLENIVVPQLKASSLRYFIVRGSLSSANVPGSDHTVDFMTTNDLQDIIESSEFILARSGFSTIMDLAALKKRAIFIPTPGQTEQQYLARRIMHSGIAFYVDQDQFDLAFAWKAAQEFSGFKNAGHGCHNFFSKALDLILE